MLTIRDAVTEDVSAIFAITREWSDTPGHLVTAPYEVNAEHIAADIPAIQRVGKFSVAIKNGAVAGYALLRPMEPEAISHVYRLTIPPPNST